MPPLLPAASIQSFFKKPLACLTMQELHLLISKIDHSPEVYAFEHMSFIEKRLLKLEESSPILKKIFQIIKRLFPFLSNKVIKLQQIKQNALKAYHIKDLALNYLKELSLKFFSIEDLLSYDPFCKKVGAFLGDEINVIPKISRAFLTSYGSFASGLDPQILFKQVYRSKALAEYFLHNSRFNSRLSLNSALYFLSNKLPLPHFCPESIKALANSIFQLLAQSDWTLDAHPDISAHEDALYILAAVNHLLLADNNSKNPKVISICCEFNPDIILVADRRMRSNKEVMLACVKQKGVNLCWGTQEIKNDPDIVLAAITQDWTAISHAGPFPKDNEAIMRYAITKCGRTIQLASPALKKNRDLALLACHQTWHAYFFIDESLKSDLEIAKVCLLQHPWLIQHLPLSIRYLKQICLLAVSQNSTVLHVFPAELKKIERLLLQPF